MQADAIPNDPGFGSQWALNNPGQLTGSIVVGGGGTSGAKPLLVRAAGPSLLALNVTTANPDPKLALFAGPLAAGSNNDWGGTAALSNAFASVGACAYSSVTSQGAAIYHPAARRRQLHRAIRRH
jgi:hypothetical protein